MVFLREALIYLINTLFGLYLFAVLLRFLLQWVRADFNNPVSQFVVAVTNPLLRPLRRHIPGFRGIDFPSLLLMLMLKMTELLLVYWIAVGRAPRLAGLVVLSVAGLLQFAIYIFMFAVFLHAVLSWVSPGAYNPVTIIIDDLAEPLLRRARKLLPTSGMVDFSTLLILVCLPLCIYLVVNPLTAVGRGLAGVLF